MRPLAVHLHYAEERPFYLSKNLIWTMSYHFFRRVKDHLVGGLVHNSVEDRC